MISFLLIVGGSVQVRQQLSTAWGLPQGVCAPSPLANSQNSTFPGTLKNSLETTKNNSVVSKPLGLIVTSSQASKPAANSTGAAGLLTQAAIQTVKSKNGSVFTFGR